MHITRLSALLLLPALAAFTSAVETKPYVRDEAHSQINFSASSRLIDAQGFWGKWDAAIAFDPAAIDKTTLNITIDAKSVNTRVEMRDNHLKSKDFFHADSFPTITFVSKSVRATAGQPAGDLNNVKLIITGDLTQIDLPKNQKSGLEKATRILKNIDGIGHIELNEDDVVRHRLVKAIIRAYDRERDRDNNPRPTE